MDEPSIPNEKKTMSDTEILWNSAGMHRPIASFWYNFIFILLGAVPALLVVGYLIPSVILPFPSSLGMASVVSTYFALMFTLFDAGTGQAIERFIAQYAYKDPKRTLQYLTFFSWFQLFTGLMQTTIVAIYSLYVIRTGDDAYLVWMFLIFSLTQYPGMLGVYKHALAAFQRHDKQIIVELFQNILIQSLTQIIFILLGRYWGRMVPQIGEGMGAAFGYIIGSYVDDFLGMVLSGIFFTQIIKPLGYNIIDTLRPDFDWTIIKEVLTYGLKILPAYAVNALVSFLVLLMTMSWLPNYTTIIAIVSLASGIASVTSTSFSITSALSEAYNNGYYKLAQYYIRQQWKHWFLIATFLFVEVALVAPAALRVMAGDYAYAANILIILLFTRLLVFPINFGSSVAQAMNKPEYHTYALIAEQTARAFSYFFFLNPWWGMVTIFGPSYALIFYVFADFPAFCVKLVVQWGLVKRDMKFSIAPPFYQTFIAPILTAIPLILITYPPLMLFNYVVSISEGNLLYPIITIAITLIVALFTFPIFILFPVYGLFGGWDDDGLEAFQNASKISGPSRFLVRLMVKYTTWGHNHSPLKNRFPIPYGEAKFEAEILSKKRIKLYLEGKNPDEDL